MVIQNNLFNVSSIRTLVVCAITSNQKRANSPGNVSLRKGEANLPKASVVNISQVYTINKDDLGEKIGMISQQRLREVLDGFKLLIEPKDVS